ncbi:DNA polymerase III subunit gamma/tau [Rickettsiella grylli]|uniref:DNA polymerase III subunit gamma/tau n=1 Tax=Rickettsiella grylli TaxID=59196 RepID=A8PNF7_9COXI|nr:DNA polymerase III subunit gamma/tau [Rickettsiella grylli]EDP46189.1 DNA polymerase III subunit tau [Rickettsiella grylli]
MSYQVLARKYRPQSFDELIGQESTCRILKNALRTQRIHHAYLFTGTRGVGKTTLARLLAKCLNCQTQITPEPCNQCISCQAIHANRFTDLIEVDAASRTKVEDTRDLLADVHYTPSQGRYKIYLIDEVHMLSSHSFNALLKTLEEPPPHVIFLLATTDTQRLPATILSRCLQFHLKTITTVQISNQLANILKKEKIPFEPEALAPLAQAAQGSLRDALSLLDQAIAYTNQNLTKQDINTLLGHVAHSEIIQLLDALILEDTAKLWSLVEQFSELGVDFSCVMDELLTCLHQMALSQRFKTEVNYTQTIIDFAQTLSPEAIQLYYQIVLFSRRDITLAPTPRLGFEMMLLRLLAFKPAGDDSEINPIKLTQTRTPAPEKQPIATHKTDKTILPNNEKDLHWPTLIAQLKLTGLTHALAQQCALQSYHNNHVSLCLDPRQAALRSAKQETKLAHALSEYFKKPITLSIGVGDTSLSTPARLEQQHQSQRLEQATEALQNDPTLQAIMQTFDAKLQPQSIQILDKE